MILIIGDIMTQKDSTSLNPFVRFWGMLVIDFLFLAACITCLKLFPTDSSISEKTDIHGDDLLAEIPLIEDLVPQEDANLPVVEVSYTEGSPAKEALARCPCALRAEKSALRAKVDPPSE